MSRLLRNRTFNFFLVLLVLAVWGFAFVFIRVVVREIPPVSLAFLRFVIALVVLSLIPAPRPPDLSRAVRFRLVLMGLTGVALYFIFENWSLVHTTATNASIIVCTIPVMTLIGAVIFYRERWSWANAFGSLLSFVGCALVIWNGNVNFRLNPLGDFLMILACITWAVYTLLSRNVVETLSPIFVARRMILVGVIFLLPFFIFDLAAGRITRLSPFSILSVFYLGLLCSALAYVLWNQALRVLGMVFVSNLLYLQCIFTMIAAALTIHEPVTLLLLVFTGLVFVGVFLANLPPAPRGDTSVPPGPH